MGNEIAGQGEILLYNDDKEKEYVSVIFAEENFWLSQNGMAELFGCTPENIIQHLKNIYAEEELLPDATAKKFLVVRKEGSRNVRRSIDHYNLDAIIAVGYRVNSKKAPGSGGLPQKAGCGLRFRVRPADGTVPERGVGACKISLPVL